jgi:thioredoxin 1
MSAGNLSSEWEPPDMADEFNLDHCIAGQEPVIPQSDDGLTALLQAQPCPVVILVSTDDCVPCIFIKPILRKIAAQFAGKMMLVDVTDQTTPAFKRSHQIDAFPTVLMFKDGAIQWRKEGFDGTDDIYRSIAASLGINVDEDEISPRAHSDFEAVISEARATVDAMMVEASDALMPDIEAITPSLEAAQSIIRQAQQAGHLSAAEARRQMLETMHAFYHPFQDKIDTLRAAQGAAMRVYEAKTAKGLRMFIAARSAAPGERLVCSADGSVCELVPEESAEPGR